MIMATAELTPASVGIHHVLIGTDLSHQSDVALRYGLGFVRLYGAEAEIVYVMPTEEYVMAGPEGMLAARDASRRDLLELKSRMRRSHPYDEDTDYHVTMVEGDVAECLLQCAREKKIDLIVLGTHGRSGLGKALLGSVAEKVFRHSAVPVLTIGPNIHRLQGWQEVRKIVAPCDLTPKSHSAMRYACALAKAHNSELTVVHVIDGANEGAKVDPERVKAGVRERLSDIISKLSEGLEVQYRIEFGRVSSTILDVASAVEADLIVLGVRPSSGLFDRFQWPVAYELVREATCPVLTIRGKTPVH